jgi:hypothetical protein
VKKPVWQCRNKADQDYLAKWTTAKLDAGFDEADPPIFKEDEIRIIERHYSKRLARRRRITAIEQAVKDNDVDTLVRLTDDPPLRRFAFQQFHPGSGRKKGQRRHEREYSHIERVKLKEASADVERIRALWQQEFQRRNRSHRNPPTAEAIAASLWGIKELELRKFRKNT